MHSQSNRSILPAVAIALTMISASCSPLSTNPLAGSPNQPTVSLTIIDGNNQTVPAGGQFPAPVRVQVNTTSGYLSELRATLIDPANSGWSERRDVPGSGIIEFRPQVGTTAGPYSLRIDYLFGSCWDKCNMRTLAIATATGTIVP